jgi:hypothetical protein
MVERVGDGDERRARRRGEILEAAETARLIAAVAVGGPEIGPPGRRSGQQRKPVGKEP